MIKNVTKSKIFLISLFTIIMLIFSGACVHASSVEYKGESEGLIAAPDDFFQDFGTLLPGDKREGVAYIKNTTNDEIEVFFKTEPIDKSEYYDDIDYSLLEKISLKISLKSTSSSSEKLLYEGNLGAESMSEFISLGSYKKGFDGEFLFEIEVPTSLRNDYTLARTMVKWVFAVEKKKEDKPDEKPDEEPDNKPEPKPSDDSGKSDNEGKKDDNSGKKNDSKQNPVQTGDKIYYVFAIMVIAILIIILAYIPKNKRRK